MGRNGRFLLCGESFVPVVALHAVCPESFVPGRVRCVADGWWSAGEDSPCSGCLRLHREKVLPARLEWAESGVICCAGRVLYRGVCAAWLVSGGLREKIRPAGSARVANAKFFAQRAQNRPKRAIFAVLGEFFRGVCLGGGLLGVLCRGISLQLSPLLRSARPVATRR